MVTHLFGRRGDLAAVAILIAGAFFGMTDGPRTLAQAPPRPTRLGGDVPAELPLPARMSTSDDDLLAPLNLSPPRGDSSMMSDQQRRDFVREQEERAIRAERAKLEARARFEARANNPMPRLQPTQTTPSPASPNQTAITASDEPTAKNSAGDIVSPSDLPFSLGSEAESDPPRAEADAPSIDDLVPRLPRRELLPPSLSHDEDKPADRPASPPSENDRAEIVDAPRDRDASSRPSSQPSRERSAHSILSAPAPMSPKTLIVAPEDPFRHWDAPPQHRYAVASEVFCHSCGGCVDRNGTGCCDATQKFLGIGIGSGMRPRCQCWRCPQAPPFNLYGPGNYAGPARPIAIPEYRLRAGDQIQLTFMIRSIQTDGAYRLVVGDELLVESEADEKLTRGTLERGLEIQPDGTISLRFIGSVHAAGRTVEQLRDILNDLYTEYYPEPSIDVTPVKTGSVARQIREAISGSEGFNPQTTIQTVSPEGTIRLPRIGAIPTQGLTLAELKREINLRYAAIAAGLEVEPNLQQQAPHFVYVLGEVGQPGRFEMTTPTTVLGAIALAGGHQPGGNVRQVVVFRRGPNWELLSTLLDLRGAVFGKVSNPADEIWVQDNDVIIIPPTPILVFDRFVNQVFTEGIYGIVPFGGVSITLGQDGSVN